MDKKKKDKGDQKNNRMLDEKTNEDFNKQKPGPGGPAQSSSMQRGNATVLKNKKRG
jgi:hypothetical protein